MNNEKKYHGQLQSLIKEGKESGSKYLDILDALPVAIVEHAADTKILFCNLNALKMLGLNADEAKGKIASDPKWIFHREDGTEMPLEEFPVIQVIDTQAPLNNFIVGVEQPDSLEIAWLLVDAYPQFDEAKALETVLVTFIDITKLKQLEAALIEANKKLEQFAFLDGLTGVTNRRMFDLTLEREWSRAQRSNSTLSLIMADIDFFKLYNDNYGHLNGDDCLKKVAQALNSIATRGTDMVARYGGEEFVILLPDTDIHQAIQIAEKCRRSVVDQKIVHEYSEVNGLDVVSISLGVTSITPSDKAKPFLLIDAADKLLYKAKGNGRNRVEYG